MRHTIRVVGGLPERKPGNDLIDVRDELGGIGWGLIGNANRRFLMQSTQKQQGAVLQGERPITRQHEMQSLVNQSFERRINHD